MTRALLLCMLALASCKRREIPSPRPAAASFVTHRFRFVSESVKVTVKDLGMQRDLSEVLRQDSEATLVVNGGFFGELNEPLGLAVSEGHTLSKWRKPLGGGVLTLANGVFSLQDGETEPSPTSFALQCKPRLVVSGRVNIKRDDGRQAARTAICLRAKGSVVEVVLALSPEKLPSLYELAQELARTGCEDALNLDGGPSSGVAYRDGSSIAEERPPKPVRHAVVFRGPFERM